tara:strand:- start:233 stop:454 length:222 start_codon:yes stop_codon:yes gene_type:complete
MPSVIRVTPAPLLVEQIGDLSKEADARIKATVAEMRGKEDYECALSIDGRPAVLFGVTTTLTLCSTLGSDWAT